MLSTALRTRYSEPRASAKMLLGHLQSLALSAQGRSSEQQGELCATAVLMYLNPRAWGCLWPVDSVLGGGGSEVTGQRISAHPPSCPNTGQVLVQGAKVRKHGVAVCGQACVAARYAPWITCCRQKPSLPLHDYKRVSNRPTYTPEHKSTWNHTYTNTLIPILTLPAACTKLQTTFSVGLEPQKRWIHKKPKSAETWGRHVWTSPF